MSRLQLPWKASLLSLLLVAGTEARANFSYASTSSTPVVTSGSLGGSVIRLGPVSSGSLLTTPTDINLLTVSDTTATPSGGPTDAFTLSFTDTIVITNVPPPGTSAVGTLSFSGTLTFTRSDSGGELSSFAVTSISGPTQIDGLIYTLSSLSYTPPTVNSPNGATNISGQLTATPAVSVPEPASAVLIGLGLAGACLARRARKLA